AIDPRAERSMYDELHSAAFIEETFRHDSPLARQCTERRRSGAHVNRALFGATPIERAFTHEPFDRIVLFEDFGAYIADFFRQFDSAARRFSAPEGNRGRSA